MQIRNLMNNRGVEPTKIYQDRCLGYPVVLVALFGVTDSYYYNTIEERAKGFWQ